MSGRKSARKRTQLIEKKNASKEKDDSGKEMIISLSLYCLLNYITLFLQNS